MASGGQDPPTTQGGSKITLTENEVKTGQNRTEGTSSGMTTEVPATLTIKVPALMMDDVESRGAQAQEEGYGCGGLGVSLGSAGQSPSSTLSSHSSPLSLLPSPSSSSGRSFLNSTQDPKFTTDSFGQSNLQPNYSGNKDGFYIQGFQVPGQGQGLFPTPKQISGAEERVTLNPSITGSTSLTPGNKEDQKKPDSASTSGGLLRSLKENSTAGVTGNQTLKPFLDKQNVDTQPAGTVSLAADLTGGKAGATAGPTAGLPPDSAYRANVDVGVGAVKETNMESGNLSHTEKRSYIPSNRGKIESGVAAHGLSQDFNHIEDIRVGSCGTLNSETKPSQGTELPQRTAVRRAMSDCSHLSVPTVITGTYPTGNRGSPVMTPSVPNFTLMGTACQPRTPYPHVAVRRSLTVTGGTEAAAAMATIMSSPLITSPVLPSSPPPKRHHGNCETSFLLPVPPPAGMAVNSSQDRMTNTFGKRCFLRAHLCKLGHK